MRIYCFLVYVIDNPVTIFILIGNYYHPVYVPLCGQVISYEHVPHRYWDTYDNIS